MAEIDNLSIPITASADEAAAKIRSFASSLHGVGKAGKEAAGDMKVLADEFKTDAASSRTGATHAKSFGDRLRGLASHIRETASSAKSGSGRINNFVASLRRIAYYRFIRSVLKEIAQGFREGITNLYQWSSAVNGNFATSMNTIATATNYLKNSLGAVAAPLINSLAPAIDFVIDKFVALLNVINQFIAALTGASTYTAARKVSTEWGKATKSVGAGAKAAAKEIRTLLGFDEINKLDDASGGGGGGGGGGGSSGGAGALFEERPINSTIMKIADVFRTVFTPIFDFISENLNWILPTVGAIGAALLAWKIGNGLVSSIASINTSIGAIALALASLTAGVVISINTIELAKSEGLTWRVAGSWLAGSAAFGVAGMAIAKLLGLSIGAGGAIGFGLGLGVTGTILTAELVKQDSLTWKSAATGAASIFGYGMAGAGIAYLISKAYPSLGITSLKGGLLGFGLGLAIVGTVTTAELVKRDGVTWKSVGSAFLTGGGGAIAGSTLAKMFPALGISSLKGGLIGFGLTLAIEGSITSVQLAKKDGLTWKTAGVSIFAGAGAATAAGAAAKALGLSTAASLGLAGGAFAVVVGGLIAYAYIKQVEMRKDLIKWGDVELSAQEIEAEVQKRLTFDVDAIVNLTSSTLQNWEDAKNKLNLQIALFQVFVDKVKIGAVMDDDAITDAYNTLKNDIIPGIQEELKQGQNVVEVAFSLAAPTDAQGNPLDASAMLSSMAEGNQILMQGLSDYGRELGEILSNSYGEAMDEGTAQMIQDYFGAISRVNRAIQQGRTQSEFKSSMERVFSDFKLSDMTFDSFVRFSDAYIAKTQEGLQSLVDIHTNAKAALEGELAGLQQFTEEQVNLGKEVPEHITQRINELTAQIAAYDPISSAYAEWEKNIAPYTVEFMDMFSTVFGDSISEVFDDAGVTLQNQIKAFLQDDHYKNNVGAMFDAFMKDALGDNYEYVINVADQLNLTGWDLVGVEVRQKFVDALVGAMGAPAAIAALNKVGYDLTGLIIDGMSPDNMKVGETIRKLGANMAKKIEYEIAQGKIQTPIEIVRKGWTTVTNWVNGNKGNTSIEAPVKLKKEGWLDPIANLGLSNLKSAVSVALKKSGWSEPIPNLKLSDLKTTVSVSLKKTWKDPIAKLGADDLKATLNVTPNLTKSTIKISAATAGNQIKLETTKALGGIFSAGRWHNLPQYANGTLNAGTIFAAGEAGPEVVGHIGGRTEVLNQSQLAATMFAAVRNAMSGVRIEGNITNDTANDEDMAALMEMVRAESDATVRQNDLLRQQNDYLRRIAEKEFSADISTAAINRAQNRMNRRAGMTVVPVDM